MSDNLSVEFDKRFGLADVKRGVNGGTLAKVDQRLRLLHAYVLDRYGTGEITIGKLGSEFRRDTGLRIGALFDCPFTDLFASQSFQKYFRIGSTRDSFVAYGQPVTQSKGEVLVAEIQSLDGLSVERIDARRKDKERRERKIVFDNQNLTEGQVFFGTYYSQADGANAYPSPFVSVTYLEGIGSMRGVSVKLEQMYAGTAKKGEFVVGRVETGGRCALFDVSERVVLIRRWSDFIESKGRSFRQYLDKGGKEITLSASKTPYKEIIIIDSGEMYKGFFMPKRSRKDAIKYAVQEVYVAGGLYEELNQLKQVFSLYGLDGEITNGRERLKMGKPLADKWADTNAFFVDEVFWKRYVAHPVDFDDDKVVISVDGGRATEAIVSDGATGASDRKQVDDDNVISETAGAIPVSICTKGERSFLERFLKEISQAGYRYVPRDVVRFHTSVKTGMFTLLGGAPGCGKSSLAALYAKALRGANAERPDDGYLAVDVSPAWTEPDDLMGYWSLEGRFVSASSGIVPFLQQAAVSPKVQLVCFEEMNLARIEHYFANFIQVISRAEDERWLDGVPATLDGDRSQKLLVARNLRFVGTNNFDETTQQISSRFYDRCNYIELQEALSERPLTEGVPCMGKCLFDFGVTYEEYARWSSVRPDAESFAEAVIEKLRELRPALHDLRLDISRRVENGIAVYIANRPFTGLDGIAHDNVHDAQLAALDEAIVQRVLPKYRPNFQVDERQKILNLLKSLEGLELSSQYLKSKTDVTELPQRA